MILFTSEWRGNLAGCNTDVVDLEKSATNKNRAGDYQTNIRLVWRYIITFVMSFSAVLLALPSIHIILLFFLTTDIQILHDC